MFILVLYISLNAQFGLQDLSTFVGETSFIVLSVSSNVHFLLSCVWLVFVRVANCVVVGVEFVVSCEFQLRSFAGRED
jgi:hypothetical protein